MPALHPTILIGCGAYGLSVLRRLLESAADRGVLEWEEPPGGASVASRRLKDLGLLSVGDAPRRGRDDDDDPGGTALEIARDLYRQIEHVALGGRGPEAFAAALETSKSRLLSAAGRAADEGRLRLGLDVIVLAQPSDTATLGALEAILVAGLVALGSDPTLRERAEGHDLLNVVQVLDFDNYWDPSPKGRQLRQEVQHFAQRVTSHQPAVGRMYVVDGHPRDGTREVAERVDEIVLFLEFLLFEGQRDCPDLRRLYQRDRENDNPVLSIGLRSFERDPGLVSRLAAAYFARGWLPYLAAEGPANPPTLRPLRELLAEYEPEKLLSSDVRRRLHELADSEVAGLGAACLSLPVDAADWPAQVRGRCLPALQRLRQRLAVAAGRGGSGASEPDLQRFRRRLEDSVSALLTDREAPEPLGTPIRELEAFVKQSARLGPTAADGAGMGKTFPRLEGVHAAYRRYRDTRVSPTALSQWWLLLALAVAAAFTPIVLDAAAGLPVPDASAHHVWRAAHQVVTAAATPIVVAPALLAAAWLVAGLTIHRRVVRRLERARRFFTHPERGRFAAGVRDMLDEAIRPEARRQADRTFEIIATRVRSGVHKEVARVLALLQARRREMSWLRDQLRDYLGGHGLDPDRPPALVRPVGRGFGTVRHSLELQWNLQEALARNPSTPERFQSTQASQAPSPFATWEHEYSDTFLYPVGFLDRLSEQFRASGDHRLGVPSPTGPPDAETSVLVAALGRRALHDFNPDFNWEAAGTPQVAPIEKYCILPEAWTDLPVVCDALRKLGYERLLATADNERGYLLQVQYGVPLTSLVEVK